MKIQQENENVFQMAKRGKDDEQKVEISRYIENKNRMSLKIILYNIIYIIRHNTYNTV